MNWIAERLQKKYPDLDITYGTREMPKTGWIRNVIELNGEELVVDWENARPTIPSKQKYGDDEARELLFNIFEKALQTRLHK